MQQCVVRYGKPIKYTEADPTKTPFGTITFAAGGYALTVFVINNMEVGARVFKIDKSAFTPSEMQSIMGADTAGSQWTSVPSSDPACLQWDRSDKATVLYDKDKRMLIFTSEAMAQALHLTPDKPEVDSSTNAATTNATITQSRKHKCGSITEFDRELTTPALTKLSLRIVVPRASEFSTNFVLSPSIKRRVREITRVIRFKKSLPPRRSLRCRFPSAYAGTCFRA